MKSALPRHRRFGESPDGSNLVYALVLAHARRRGLIVRPAVRSEPDRADMSPHLQPIGSPNPATGK